MNITNRAMQSRLPPVRGPRPPARTNINRSQAQSGFGPCPPTDHGTPPADLDASLFPQPAGQLHRCVGETAPSDRLYWVIPAPPPQFARSDGIFGAMFFPPHRVGDFFRAQRRRDVVPIRRREPGSGNAGGGMARRIDGYSNVQADVGVTSQHDRERLQ